LGGTTVASDNHTTNWFASRGVARLWAALPMGAQGWLAGTVQQRAPDFSEWMGSTGGVVPSLDLKSELSRTGELGVEWTHRRFKLSSSVWISRFDDPIQARLQGGTPMVAYSNGSGTGATGWDAKLFVCTDHAAFTWAGTVQDAFLRDANSALDGNRPMRTPAAKTSLEWQLGPWKGLSAGYVLDAQSQVWASDLNTPDDRRPSWVMHGVWLKYHLGHLGISAMAKNLGDVRLPDLEDMPLQGRQFLLRMELDFSTNQTIRTGVNENE